MDISTERWRVRAGYRSESEQGAHFSVTPNTAKPHSTIRLSVFAPPSLSISEKKEETMKLLVEDSTVFLQNHGY
ncbi:hypothetical protein F511_37236 [Dorcoceras hygrometricum]|uniref:Uncharacterized protein n=1 Tax=Dorcoceras hygrometricum TaxID=472368 RepID=A0A2Z7D3F6_9LAMI|nr:hypothetical protein F511_37236 [Dorcoceras hygrometricum]